MYEWEMYNSQMYEYKPQSSINHKFINANHIFTSRYHKLWASTYLWITYLPVPITILKAWSTHFSTRSLTPLMKLLQLLPIVCNKAPKSCLLFNIKQSEVEEYEKKILYLCWNSSVVVFFLFLLFKGGWLRTFRCITAANR